MKNHLIFHIRDSLLLMLCADVSHVLHHKTGICVTNPLQVSVQQAVSVDVPLPYSMVRGEQIELKGSVYNDYLADTTVRLIYLSP